MQSVQDILISDLLEVNQEDSNETVQLLEFMKNNGVPLTESQVSAFFLLRENGLDDIADFAFSMRKAVTPKSVFFDLVSKLTLADRIKGNAKLSHLLKASANPANGVKPEDMQAKGMSRKEIDK